MMKKAVQKSLLLSVLILSACSSSEVQPDEPKAAAEIPAVNTTSSEKEKVVVEKNIPEIKREEKVSTSQYSPLTEAIRQQNDEAIQKTASEILTQNSKDLMALNSMAMVYYKKGRFEAAEYLLGKALAVHPDSSEVYSNRGLVLLAMGERREAIRSFRKAIELNPNNAVAGANVGSLYVQDKDYNKAALSLEIAVKNGQRDFKVMNNYALALAATGKTKEAADIYDRLIKDNPSQKDVMLNYSILMIEQMQKYREGLDLLNRLKFVGNAPESREIIKQLENKAKAGLQ